MKYSLQKRISAFVLAFALVMTTAFNSIGATTKADAAAKVKTLYLTKKTTSLVEGETGTAQWAVRATKATKALAAVKVTTSDSSVVKITKTTQSKKAGKTAKAAKKNKGTVKFEAVSAGTATIKIVTKKKTKKTKSFKVTVTAKSTEAPTTTQASAEATTNAAATTAASATTQVPASADASGDTLKSVTLSNTNPKVGDTITASIIPANLSVTYTWELLDVATATKGTEVSGEASLKVTEAMVNKYIKVTVKDAKNNILSATTSDVVKADLASSVILTDENGLQTDGNGVINDTLTLSYGSDVGNPKYIKWFRDDVMLASYTDKASSYTPSNGLDSTASGLDTSKTGKYYVVIETETGKVITSNTVILTDAEATVVLSNFTLENYEVDNAQEFLPLTAKTDTIVATVKVNRVYDGDFYLYDASLTKPAKSIVPLNSNAAGFKSVSKGNFTNKYALENHYKLGSLSANGDFKGIYVDNPDGSRTYKFVVDTDKTVGASKVTNGGTLTRGTSYCLGYDQTNLSSDNIDVSANAIGGVVAPYVTKPAKVKVTAYDKNSTKASVTFYDANEKEVAYMNTTGTNENGFTIEAVAKASNSSSADDKGKDIPAASTSLSKGVATFTDVSLDTQYFYAKVKTADGVFSAKSETLTTALVETAKKPMTGLILAEDSKTPANAKITLKDLDLRASGTVYLLQGDNGVGTAAGIAVKATSTALGSAKVKDGAGTAEIAGVFKNDQITGAGDNLNDFVAVFVPDDPNAFTSFYSGINDTAKGGQKPSDSALFTLVNVATSYEVGGTTKGITTGVSGTGALTAATLVTKNQFGVAMATSKIGKQVAATAPDKDDVIAMKYAEATGASVDQNLGVAVSDVAGDDNAKIFLVATDASAGAAVGDSYTYKIADGFFIKATCTEAGVSDTAEWTISISNAGN